MAKKDTNVTTAFVLSGGGSLGSVQVGMLQALAAHGVEPDLLIGTSVGALNAAYLAGHGLGEESLDELARTWLGLRSHDVFPIAPFRLGLAAVGRVESLCSNGPLRRLIRTHLTFDLLEDAPVPLHVVTTELRSGKEVLLSRGDAVDAVLASAAIPAVFPSVDIEGNTLVDGGIADNAALSQAIELGADRIYVLPTGYPCDLTRRPRTPLSAAVHALTLLIQQRLIIDVEHYSSQVDIRVMPPLCPLDVSSVDFRHTGHLIDDSRAATAGWLQSHDVRSDDPGRILALHTHHH